MYSTFSEEKSVIIERFIRTLKNKIFKHMTAFSKNIYFNALNDIVNNYNNTVHRTIKVKPIDVTTDSYAEYNEDSKLVIMLEFLSTKIFLLKDILQIVQKKFLLLVKLKIQFRGLMLLMILMVKKLKEVFTKKNCKKLFKKNLE